ncbi:MAG: cob(I)alamin adenosyltransferase [Chloroflexi bacterium]|nr:MAG: cob(I)alamin adenosyltransferase [Chloroflexota bacterium]
MNLLIIFNLFCSQGEMPRVYTRSGDDGDTGLLYGGRISKSDLLTETYGTVDELVSTMGFARPISQSDKVKETLMKLQKQLFQIASELATLPENYSHLEKNLGLISGDWVEALEQIIDTFKAEVELPSAFIVPGASRASAVIDISRSICRRAERLVVELKNQNRLPNLEVLRYMNRLSDLLFVIARYEDKELPFELTTGG